MNHSQHASPFFVHVWFNGSIHTTTHEGAMFSNTYGQISPSGVVLQTISPDGALFKDFPAWGTFGRVLHACSTQTARTTGEFGVCEKIAIHTGDTCMHSEQLTTSNGDMHKA